MSFESMDGPAVDLFDAVIIAGGSGRRLGTVDKPGLLLEGRQLLDWVLDGVDTAAQRILVAAPDQPSALRAFGVSRCTERPIGAGPLAALRAGFDLTEAPIVVVLAGDLPFVAPAVAPLRRLAAEQGAAALVDREGRQNLLASAWRRETLGLALDLIGDPTNLPMRMLVEHAQVAALDDQLGWGADCDGWDDLQRARERAALERSG